MTVAIVYGSYHHGNTKKVIEAMAEGNDNVELIDALKAGTADLSRYDLIGFASGMYFSKFHKSVLRFAADNLPEGKKVFFVCTYGGTGQFGSIEEAVRDKNAEIIGRFGCKGFDTYGPFKLMGGIAKGHPDDRDLADAKAFFDEITKGT